MTWESLVISSCIKREMLLIKMMSPHAITYSMNMHHGLDSSTCVAREHLGRHATGLIAAESMKESILNVWEHVMCTV